MELKQKDFKEQYLPEILQKFNKSTEISITSNAEEIMDNLDKQINTFVKVVSKLQQSVPVYIGEIQISLLQSALYLDKKQICISAYNERGILGEEILNMRYSAEWLFTAWEQYKNDIEDKIKELHAQNYIRREAVKQMMRESMQHLTYIVYAIFKYRLMEFDRIEGTQNLLLTDDMRITVGSYRDWSRSVYQRKPEVDIFFNSTNIPLKYCVFEDVVYNKKKFQEMDLAHARFLNCEFVHCIFDNVVLTDAIFEGCRFYYCSFATVIFYGASFRQCTFKKNTAENVIWEYLPEVGEEIEDLYKEVTFEDCVNDNTIFERKS